MKPKKKRAPRLYKWWYKKIDRDMGALVRSQGQCEMCLSRTNQLQWAHAISRTNKTLRWDIINAMCLCSYCHRFRWHEQPIEGANWFRNKYPERYEYLMERKNRRLNRTEEDYKNIREAIKNKDLRKLTLDLNI